MSASADVVRQQTIRSDVRTEILQLVAAATAADGVSPLDERSLLLLRNPADGDRVQHYVARRAEVVAGYAIATSSAEGVNAELVVHPDHRAHGIGTALVDSLLRAEPADTEPSVRIWAHGNTDAAMRLAQKTNFRQARVLWQLRRPLDESIAEPVIPDGIAIRGFVPGQDDDAWLAVNSAAFAAHPEQGHWTRNDLEARMAEDWFDPAGFLIAEVTADALGQLSRGDIAGFHWTKVHDGGTPQAIGEVYVVGVEPRAQGFGLGKSLTLAGLHHLRAGGLRQVLLYVDDDNTAAMRLYERIGFTPYASDVQYARSSSLSKR